MAEILVRRRTPDIHTPVCRRGMNDWRRRRAGSRPEPTDDERWGLSPARGGVGAQTDT